MFRGPPNRAERRAEVRHRSLRVRQLPPGTQEALIQQAFEKFGKVNKLAFKEGESEAVVEFDSEGVSLLHNACLRKQ